MASVARCARPATVALTPRQLYDAANTVKSALNRHLYDGDGLCPVLNSIIVADVMLTEAHHEPDTPIRVRVKAARRALRNLRAALDDVAKMLA